MRSAACAYCLCLLACACLLQARAAAKPSPAKAAPAHRMACDAGAGQQEQCANAAPPAATAAALAAKGFPSNNTVQELSGSALQGLLTGYMRVNGTLQPVTHQITEAVLLFYQAQTPNSVALRPVYGCLPAFFNASLPFFAIEYRQMSLMALMGQSLHALPVLQVSTKGKRYRYSGPHRLADMLGFVAKALGDEPLAAAEAAATCGEGGEGACGGWRCDRTDGEATTQELAGAQHAPLFYVCVAFLAARALWLAGGWARRSQWWGRRRQLRAGGGAAGGRPRPGSPSAALATDRPELGRPDGSLQ